MKTQKQFAEYAAHIFETASSRTDPHLLREHLAAGEPAIRRVPPTVFRDELHAAWIALLCGAWETACQNNQIPDEGIRKALLRRVLSTFGSSNVAQAAVFSEYLQARDLEEQTEVSVAISKRFLERVGRPLNLKENAVEICILKLAEIFESQRMTFENEFFDFLYETRA